MTERTTYTYAALTDDELKTVTDELFRHQCAAFDAMRALYPHLAGKDLGELEAYRVLAPVAGALNYWWAYFDATKAQERRGIARYATYDED